MHLHAPCTRRQCCLLPATLDSDGEEPVSDLCYNFRPKQKNGTSLQYVYGN